MKHLWHVNNILLLQRYPILYIVFRLTRSTQGTCDIWITKKKFQILKTVTLHHPFYCEGTKGTRTTNALHVCNIQNTSKTQVKHGNHKMLIFFKIHLQSTMTQHIHMTQCPFSNLITSHIQHSANSTVMIAECFKKHCLQHSANSTQLDSTVLNQHSAK